MVVVFNRVKSATVIEQEDGIVLVKAFFIDTFHEINLELKVNIKEMLVVSAQADMVRTPHPDCPNAGTEVEKLSGIRIGPGARKAILKAVGHANGCTHLADLALDAFKAVIQANFKIQKQQMTQEERLAKFADQLGGTCYHWTRVIEQ
jgi:hypothetical protein